MAKKRNYTNWILAGIAAGGAIYFWLRQQAELIQFGNISIPFQQFKNGQINLELALPIINASSLAAKITGFSGFIVSPAGNTISSVFLKAPASVPRYEQSELRFKSSIRPTDALTELFSIIQSGGKLNLKGYRLRGQVRVYGVPIIIDMPII